MSCSKPVLWSATWFIACMMGVPAHAAKLTSPPITILSCHAENFGGYGGQVADVVVSFTNTYTSPATRVQFAFTYHGKLALATDKGSYAPNVKVTDRFRVFVDQFYKGKTMDACGVVHAAFADGSTWDG